MTIFDIHAAIDAYAAQRDAELAAANRQLAATGVLLATMTDQVTVLTRQLADAKSPSQEAVPQGDLPGWHQVLAEDFATDCTRGQLATVYPRFGLYPVGWPDTSKRGRYDPANVDVVGSVCRQFVHSVPAGPSVSAIVPRLDVSVGGWGDHAGARLSVRMRADPLPGYKVAWLLWPKSNNSTVDGEIDWPEGGLDGSTMSGFVHRVSVDGKTRDQRVVSSVAVTADWHTYTIVWLAGVSVTFLLDGVVVGGDMLRVPAHPMHWVLQTETILDVTKPIDPKVSGMVYIDWVAAWVPA